MAEAPVSDPAMSDNERHYRGLVAELLRFRADNPGAPVAREVEILERVDRAYRALSDDQRERADDAGGGPPGHVEPADAEIILAAPNLVTDEALVLAARGYRRDKYFSASAPAPEVVLASAARQRQIEAGVRWLREAIERAAAPGAAYARCRALEIAGRRYWLTLEVEPQAPAAGAADTSQ